MADMFPVNYTRVWVRGRFIDLAAAARQDETIGMNANPVRFTPSVPVLLDSETKQVISSGTAIEVYPQGLDGYFQVLLPSTDDTHVNPVGWTYNVKEPTGRDYDINVPWDTPAVNDIDDPLNGEKVIELADVIPSAGPNPGVVQLLQGRGISQMELESNGHITVTYSDGLTSDMGPFPVASIRNAADYNDGTAPTAGQVITWDSGTGKYRPGSVSYSMLPIGTGASTVAAGNDSRFTNARTPLSHVHSATDITSGTLDISRIPTGTSGTTVALGNHVHTLPSGAFNNLVDGATISTDVSGGKNMFRVTIAGNRTLAAPTNSTDGQICTWEVTASGGNRTLTVPTGSSGFDVNDTMAPTTRIVSGGKLVFTAIYSAVSQKWFVTECTPKSQPACTVYLNSDVFINNNVNYTPYSEWKTTAEVDTHGMYTRGTSAQGATKWTIPISGRWQVHAHILWSAFGLFDPALGTYLSVGISRNSPNAAVGNINEVSNTAFRNGWSMFDVIADNVVFDAGDTVYFTVYALYGCWLRAVGPSPNNRTFMTLRYLGQN